MAFGNKVTDFSQVAVGTVGYTIRIDTVSLLAYNIEFVQAQDSATSTPEPATQEVSLAVLQSYLNSTGAPDLAFNYSYNECTIFLKTSVFPYEDTTRVGLYGTRNPLKLESLDQKLDIADQDLDLFIAFVRKHAAELVGKAVPYDVQKKIKEAKAELEA